MAEARVAQRWQIGGRVQGVGYRAWLLGEARSLGLDGWVRNRSEGDVEAVVVGTAETVARLLAAARTGPMLAEVTHVAVSRLDEAVPAPGSGFMQRPTDSQARP